MARRVLPEEQVHESIRDRVSGHHRSVVDEIQGAIDNHEVVVVGMAQNPHCKRARKVLEKAGQPFHYVEYGSYISGWRKRTALKMWTGWPTFPMVFVKGSLVGGADEIFGLIGDKLTALLAAP